MKKAFLFLTCLATIMALVSCGGSKTKETAAEAGAPAPAGEPASASKAYDCKYFAMTLADGWDASPEAMGMVNVLPKGKTSPGLYFKFEGNGNAVGTAEDSINTMITGYGGSPMETTTLAGTEFKTTTYTYSGMQQTMHVAFRNGTKITITIEGVGAKDNSDIKAMLATVALK